MAFSLFNNDKFHDFVLESFVHNYIPHDPMHDFNKLIQDPGEKIVTNIDIPLPIGSFEPGETYPVVYRKLNIVFKDHRKLFSNDTLDILMGLDNLMDIQRISVFYLLNRKLFAMKYDFPFISPDDITTIFDLIKEKYGVEGREEDIRKKLIMGNNEVMMQISNFVSLSYEFIHVSPLIISSIRKEIELSSMRNEFLRKAAQKELFGKI